MGGNGRPKAIRGSARCPGLRRLVRSQDLEGPAGKHLPVAFAFHPARSPAARRLPPLPSPKCSQPTEPEAWPPPEVISCRSTVSPRRISTTAPMASRFAPACCKPQLHPAARSAAGLTPDLGRGPAVHAPRGPACPSRLRSTTCRPARDGHAGHARAVPRLDKGAVAVLQQQVVRVLRGKVRHLGHVALGDEQVQQPVVVHIGKLRRARRSKGCRSSPGIGPVRGDPALGKATSA